MKTSETTDPSKEETARRHLRAQKESYEETMRQAGLEAGRAFVLDTDEDDDVYRQMTALARHDERHDSPEDLAGLIVAMNATDTGLENWLREQYEGDPEEATWVIGFVSGALVKFRELAP
jgi:hypothetical protein